MKFLFSVLSPTDEAIIVQTFELLQKGLFLYLADHRCHDQPFAHSVENWSLSLLSVTHHTQNLVILCANGQNRKFVLKVQLDTGSGVSRLLSEAEFYLAHRNEHLPTLLGVLEHPPLSGIVLEYIVGGARLSDLIWNDRLGLSDSLALTNNILQWLIDSFSKDKRALDRFRAIATFDRYFTERVLSRNDTNSVGNSRYRHTLELKEIQINGTRCHGPKEIVRCVTDNHNHIIHLLPRFSGPIHGDPHYGNILIPNVSSSRDNLQNIDPNMFFFVDPGPHLQGPLVYDMAKIYQTFLGHYEAIIRCNYSLSRSDDRFTIAYSEPEQFVAISKHLESVFLGDEFDIEYHTHQDPPHFFTACKMAAGLHLMAAAPHHIAIEEEAEVMLLTGTLLCQEAYNSTITP